MILGKSLDQDLKLHPLRYRWAYDLYRQAVSNTWFPHEIQLGEDLSDWNKMTREEVEAVTFFISYFNPSELLVNKSLALGVYPYLQAPEAHLYLAKQMWEEANHCVAFEHVVETFPIDREKSYGAHLTTPSMRAKKDFNVLYLKRMTEVNLDIETDSGKLEFLRNLVATNIIMEGIWFYSGFMVGLSFRQRGLLRNFASMLDWVVRDESLHLKFGINLILTILEENPQLLTEQFAKETRQMVVGAVDLEAQYNRDLLPNGMLGVTAEYVNAYVQYIADRRLEELGLPAYYKTENPAKWMGTASDVYQLVNFFEATNTSYEVDAKG